VIGGEGFGVLHPHPRGLRVAAEVESAGRARRPGVAPTPGPQPRLMKARSVSRPGGGPLRLGFLAAPCTEPSAPRARSSATRAGSPLVGLVGREVGAAATGGQGPADTSASSTPCPWGAAWRGSRLVELELKSAGAGPWLGSRWGRLGRGDVDREISQGAGAGGRGRGSLRAVTAATYHRLSSPRSCAGTWRNEPDALGRDLASSRRNLVPHFAHWTIIGCGES